MGDFNTKIGKEKHLAKAAGKYTLHNETNENGNLLAWFAARNILFIMSTLHSNTRKFTWEYGGHQEKVK